jgi:hypothetical protein
MGFESNTMERQCVCVWIDMMVGKRDSEGSKGRREERREKREK